jgi:isoquinoline 1-oxidoreductase alpha subunit
MSAIKLTVNGTAREFDGDADMPLLWYLREDAGLKGSKFGCGIGQCGACTVLMNGNAMRSCLATMGALDGADVTTIEGLAKDERLHPVQQAWIDEDVAQCGYCQAGQIMATVALLRRTTQPSDDDIHRDISNICRCGTYTRVRKAVKRAAQSMRNGEQ